MSKKLVILGVNPYSKLVREVLLKRYVDIADIFPRDENEFAQAILKAKNDRYDYEYFIGVEDNAFRKEIDQKYKVNWFAACGNTEGFCGKRVKVEAGTFFMPCVTVNDDVHIGRHCLIGTGSIMDRDCNIGNYVNMDVNVVLERGAAIGDSVQLGSRATILQGVHIADGCVIAPGAMVSEDIAKPETKFGFSIKKHSKL